MNAVRLLPVYLSFIVLAAHYMRSNSVILMGLCLLLPWLLLLRRPWVPRILQLALLAGSVVWLDTMWRLWSAREVRGEPAGRMVAILAGVALFTAASSLVFRAVSLRRRYGGEPAQSGG